MVYHPNNDGSESKAVSRQAKALSRNSQVKHEPIPIANIDNLGNVHPDTMWWHYSLGNVKERPFSAIWPDTADPLMAGLKANPRAVKGRCGACQYFDICGGNTRVRAHQLTGDPWAEDPACYLHNEKIGVTPGAARLEVTPYSRQRVVPVAKAAEPIAAGAGVGAQCRAQ